MAVGGYKTQWLRLKDFHSPKSCFVLFFCRCLNDIWNWLQIFPNRLPCVNAPAYTGRWGGAVTLWHLSESAAWLLALLQQQSCFKWAHLWLPTQRQATAGQRRTVLPSATLVDTIPVHSLPVLLWCLNLFKAFKPQCLTWPTSTRRNTHGEGIFELKKKLGRIKDEGVISRHDDSVWIPTMCLCGIKTDDRRFFAVWSLCPSGFFLTLLPPANHLISEAETKPRNMGGWSKNQQTLKEPVALWYCYPASLWRWINEIILDEPRDDDVLQKWTLQALKWEWNTKAQGKSGDYYNWFAKQSELFNF